MDSSENVYFDYILFTLLMTSIVSIIYIYFFDIDTYARFIDRIFKIFVVVSVLFYIMRIRGYSLWKMLKIVTVIFVILFILSLIFALIDYFKNNQNSNRGRGLKLYGLFIGLMLIIAMRKSLLLELESLFDFK